MERAIFEPVRSKKDRQMSTLRRRVHEVLDQTAEGDRIGRLVSAGLIALIAANVAAVIIESEPWLDATYRSWLHAFEVVSILTFTAEYALRLWSAVEGDHGRYRRPIIGRLRYAADPARAGGPDGDRAFLSGRADPGRSAFHARLPPVRGIQAHSISAIDEVAGKRAARRSQAGRRRAVRPRDAADRGVEPRLHGGEPSSAREVWQHPRRHVLGDHHDDHGRLRRCRAGDAVGQAAGGRDWRHRHRHGRPAGRPARIRLLGSAAPAPPRVRGSGRPDPGERHDRPGRGPRT